MKPELVIFDCDGVLVDSEPASNEVVSQDLTRRGLPMDAARSAELFTGCTMRAVMDKARGLGADLPDDWVDQVYALTYARLRAGIPAVKGIEAVLDRLDAAGVPYCVASNGSEEKMEITLGQTGLMPRFTGAIFSAHTLGVSKPDPELFLAAAQAMGVAPGACVVIEDSQSGATAAARAGMRCFGYAEHDDGAALAGLGAKVFHDMRDLPGLLAL